MKVLSKIFIILLISTLSIPFLSTVGAATPQEYQYKANFKAQPSGSTIYFFNSRIKQLESSFKSITKLAGNSDADIKKESKSLIMLQYISDKGFNLNEDAEYNSIKTTFDFSNFKVNKNENVSFVEGRLDFGIGNKDLGYVISVQKHDNKRDLISINEEKSGVSTFYHFEWINSSAKEKYRIYVDINYETKRSTIYLLNKVTRTKTYLVNNRDFSNVPSLKSLESASSSLDPYFRNQNYNLLYISHSVLAFSKSFVGTKYREAISKVEYNKLIIQASVLN